MKMTHFLTLLLMAMTTASVMAQNSTNAADGTHAGGIRLEADHAYHIRQDVDLHGLNITLEKGARLVFEGGRIDNGTLTGNNNTVEADSTAELFGSRLRVVGSWNVSARPEWFGAHGDGIAYYDRPLRCFAGKTGVSDISKTASPITVSHPASRIVNQDYWEETPPHTTGQVFLDTIGHRFLLYDKGIYYARWANSQEWNDRSTGKVRTDLVFSDLSDRRTYVSINGRMVDIDSTMSDDAQAICRAMMMGQGNVSLRRVIYYVRTSKEGHGSYLPWRGLEGFHFQGHGATLFVRCTKAGDTHAFSQVTWGWFYQCRNGILDHLNLRALRDRDDGTPRGLHRYDSSDSRITAFHLNGCENITFRDINLRGMSHDFIIKRGYQNSGDSRNIIIDGWHSEQFTQNVFAGVRGCHIRHADLTQAPLIGTGMHIIYGQPYLKGMYISHSTFRQSDDCTTVMLTYHGGTKNADSCPDSIHYDHCVIEGARMVQGGGYQHQTFTNCLFRQTKSRILSNAKLSDNKYIIIGSRVNLTFENCEFELNSSGLINTDAKGGTPLQLTMRNCKVNAAPVKRPLIIRPGQIDIQGSTFRCSGSLFSKDSSTPRIKNCRLNGKKIPNR